MAIKLEMNGATFTFETTEEYEAFTKLHNEVAEVEAAKEEPKKETFYMIKSEYVDTDYEGQRDFKKGADEVLIGNKREADGLIALIADYEFIGDVIERFNGEDHEGKAAFSNEHVYEVTREEYEAKKAAYLAEKDAPFKVGDIITGNELSDCYAITTDEALMRVKYVSESGDAIAVEVIKHVSRPESDWHGYEVSPSYFVKTTEEEFDAKHGLESKKESKKEVPEGYEKVSFADAKEGDVVRTKTKYVDGVGDAVEENSFAIVNTVCYDGDIFIKQRMDSRSVLVDAEDVEDTLELVAKAIK